MDVQSNPLILQYYCSDFKWICRKLVEIVVVFEVNRNLVSDNHTDWMKWQPVWTQMLRLLYFPQTCSPSNEHCRMASQSWAYRWNWTCNLMMTSVNRRSLDLTKSNLLLSACLDELKMCSRAMCIQRNREKEKKRKREKERKINN